MSLSRGVSLFRRANTTLRKPLASHTVQQVRNSGGLYSYRCGGYTPSKIQTWGAEIFMGFTWWWIFWHFWHDSGHVIGEFDYPDPSSWTNEELGIPGDDED